jgi:hypothetical protein
LQIKTKNAKALGTDMARPLTATEVAETKMDGQVAERDPQTTEVEWTLHPQILQAIVHVLDTCYSTRYDKL